ncbi:TBC1 domain family member 17-like [Cimex lectularius]|uniref:TBC1 domain family member 15 n=1 Tax=Cimex lectularius TaxID=79782 RepID=A0A8I6SGZ1_CIMLE|nr:TBC1 domain family member 17-like [Cimex lectularius]XP_024081499.1 TBC1 domain family member 17-like [Cimex lectularius]
MNEPELTKRSSSSEIPTSQGREIFSHYGVCFDTPNSKDDDMVNGGTLSIVVYSFGKCIEWKPNEISVVTDQEQEWAMVNTGSRTSAGGNESNTTKFPCIKIPLSELKSYKVSSQKRKLILTSKDRKKKYTFIFQYENADCFTRSLRSVVKTKRSSRDRHTFNIIAERGDPEGLNHSFSELHLFSDSGKDTVWKFVHDLKTSPYETTLSTFSKLSEYWLYKMPEARDETNDLSHSDGPVFAQQKDSLKDYHFVVEKHDQLPPRVLTPRDPPLNLQQWVHFMDEEGRITNVEEVKQTIFKGGITPSLRYEVWKYLLDYFPWNSTNIERQALRKDKLDEYFRMKSQWISMTPEQESRFSDFHDRKSLIEKDVNRTDRTVPFYSGDQNPNLKLLNDILMTYVMYNFDLGYVQGMSDLLSPILALMSNEVDAFWCFVGFMNKVYRNFDMDQSGMKKQLSQLQTLLTAVSPELASFLEERDSGNMFFCFRWLLVWFKREFNQEEIMSLWELLWTGLPCSNFHLLICVAILDKEKNFLLNGNFGFTEILKHINELAYNMNLEDILVRATAIFKQLEASTSLTVSTRRVLGLAPEARNSTSSEEEENIEEPNLCDVASPSPESDGCDRGMDLYYL